MSGWIVGGTALRTFGLGALDDLEALRLRAMTRIQPHEREASPSWSAMLIWPRE
jgi:hypothetical protein